MSVVGVLGDLWLRWGLVHEWGRLLLGSCRVELVQSFFIGDQLDLLPLLSMANNKFPCPLAIYIFFLWPIHWTLRIILTPMLTILDPVIIGETSIQKLCLFKLTNLIFPIYLLLTLSYLLPLFSFHTITQYHLFFILLTLLFNILMFLNLLYLLLDHLHQLFIHNLNRLPKFCLIKCCYCWIVWTFWLFNVTVNKLLVKVNVSSVCESWGWQAAYVWTHFLAL